MTDLISVLEDTSRNVLVLAFYYRPCFFFLLFENNIAEDSVSAVFSGHRIIRIYN